MKKIENYSAIILVIIILACLLLLPMIFTKRFLFAEETEKIEITAPEEVIDFGEKYKTINLLHKESGLVESVELDEYLVNVVAAEMPVDFEEEALKAQATVARTYTLYQIENGKKHENADICDDSNCCQAWISKEKRFSRWEDNQEEKWKKIQRAVYSTAGDVITYNGKPIDAFFHSNSGGTTEIPINVWGGSNFPYLQVVETVGEDEYGQYYSERELSKVEIENKMRQSYSDFEINWEDTNCIEILEYTESSRIKAIKVGNKNISGVEARKIFELKSANFNFEILDDKIKFTVIGYGHGVGLSQTGSNTLAKQGFGYKEIINHFYKDIEIINIQN